jgi:hypothetical protein
MSWNRLRILVPLTALWLCACGIPPTATKPASPVPLWVSYSPYLAGIQEALHACAAETSHLAVFFEQIPGAQQDFEDQDLVIWWGEVPPQTDFAYPLNNDELVVIVNPGNPKQALNRTELISLFSGNIESWTEIGTLDQPVKVWIFPEGNLMSESFQSRILGGQRITRLASLAPSSQAMLDSVAGDPGAIGFLPRSWLTTDVQAIEIAPAQQNSVRKPLLALTQAEPHGDLKALIACLQSGPGQAVLSGYYDQSQ